MKTNKFYLQILAIFCLFALIISYDDRTQSNYDAIPIINLSGEFKIDFDNKIVLGNLIYNLKAKDDGKEIIFDTNKLNIKKIYRINPINEAQEPIEYNVGEEDKYLGAPLNIYLKFIKDEELQLKIEYETKPDGISAQFLTPEQTFGKKYPYFFTQSKMILGRSLFPCQDTPSIKFKFDLNIIVPKDLRGMISGKYTGVSDYKDDIVYSYKQDIPIPSYLLSLAAGNIKEKQINDMITLYTEPEYIDEVYKEIYEDIPKAIDIANNYAGKFIWDKFNILVLPRSFPYSGVENPNLVFLSPCVINGDKSLIDIIIQMIMHHWSGNLVTNENWRDFWINGGIALFLRRKIMGLLRNDNELARMDGYMGMYYIQFWIDYFGKEKEKLTKLRPIGLENPEDYFTNIPYEKGYNFIYYIEHLIGEEIMEKFFKAYFEDFKYQSIDFDKFKKYFIDFCLTKMHISEDILGQINWEKWMDTPGDIPEKVEEENKYKKQAEKILEKIKEENFDNLFDEFNKLPTISKIYIFSNISYGKDDFLTEKQHKFFTETLKLYENQNFLTTVNYLYMILKKTDKFLEHELDCLINTLSNYGVKDYLFGLYQEFYKRDEIKAQEILKSLKEFYHPLMFNKAQEEIDKSKQEFPILELNVEGDVYNLPTENIVLTVKEYKEEFGELNLTDNIYLMSESEKYPLICFLKSEGIQYCKLKDITSFNSSGEYILKVTERIQKSNYAVKVFESAKFTVNQLLDIKKLNKNYYFDYKYNNSFLISIYFVEESFDKVKYIPAIFDNNNEIELSYQRDEETCSYIYEINKTIIVQKYNIAKEYTNFKVNFISNDKELLFEIDVNIKDSEKEESEEVTDVSTLSNYKNISINYIKGKFIADFDNKVIMGDLYYNLTAKEDGNQIIFDTNELQIIDINQIIEEDTIKLNHSYGEEDENLGKPLIMNLNYTKGEYIIIRIIFNTTEKGNSVQFLTPEQTFGKQYPYLFTQSEMILGRSLFPCQDTPSIKFKFDLEIIVPKELRGMLSGIFVGVNNYTEVNTKGYIYKQEIPIPSYLLSIAAGNIIQKNITDNISVFSEPEFVEEAFNETKEDLPKVLELIENYTGLPYEWGEYNILVLPRSFPFSGMENPCLSFLSPCLINGDKSLVDIIFHEMIHSWSGNLVTNEVWCDFWLNEGITNFLQRKIMGLLRNDQDYARMDGINGLSYIKEAIENFGEDQKEFTKLRPNLTGINPDDVYSDIPYEKGYNFIYYIETLIGEEKLQKFFQSYFEHFKYQSINYFQFKNYFINFCRKNEIENEILQQINWTEWIFTPGDLPVEIEDKNNTYKIIAEQIGNKILSENLDNISSEFTNLPTISKTYIFTMLSEKEGFLTEKQHKFFTENLTLYKNQNFLVSTNYFRLILQKTNKFLDHELNSLINYLSNYGASDYMVGIYGAFYKRDEIKSVETLKSLKTFYHSLMYKMAEEEIQQAEIDFPIMELNVNKDKIYYYPYEDIFDLEVEKYTDDLDMINIDKNVYLVLNNQTKLELNCTIKNTESKYCKLNDIKSLEKTGQYSINVEERVQELNYAIKVFESNKFEVKQFLDRSKTKTSYTFDLGKEDKLKIILNLNEEIKFDLPIYFNNSKELKLNCISNNHNYECDINKTFCESNCKVNETYPINILSKSEEPFFKIEILIRNTTSSGSDDKSDSGSDGGKDSDSSKGGNKTLVIVLPCVGAALIIIVAIVIIVVIRKKRSSRLSSEEISKELVSIFTKDDENLGK